MCKLIFSYIIYEKLNSWITELLNYLYYLQVETTSHAYRPTVGVRIVEFETAVSAGHIQANMEVELWDCGGENENNWPALAAKADGWYIYFL